MAEILEPQSERRIGNHELPIWQVMPEIVETLKAGNRLALISETGSGKSTQVPQALWQAGFTDEGTIYVVENRVVVATEVAKRVANEMHVPIGSTVGYITGPEKKASPDSKIVFVTNGVFKNIVRNDPLLKQSAVVIFDEFDERYLLSDIGLALTEKAQERGSNTKFILMSATLNAGKIQNHFAGIPLIEAQGRPYPVTTHFADHDIYNSDLPKEAARVAAEINSRTDNGDTLIFMPGKAEIEETIQELLKAEVRGATLLPLHAELPPEERSRVFKQASGRKIIVSTNVAERGVTIDGVKFVIDSGLVRMNDYDPVRDVTKLGVVPCAKDSMRQRQGRAGRTQPGECYFLVTEGTFAGREASTKPEILRSSLRSIVLQIKAMGYSREGDPIRLMDAPEKQNWITAKNQLRLLGALNPQDETELSAFGLELSELGCDPREAAMLLKGCELGCGQDMAIIAAIRSGSKRLLYRPQNEGELADKKRQDFRVSKQSDLVNLLQLYRQAEAVGFEGSWCREHFVSWVALQEVRRTAEQLIKQVKVLGYHIDNSTKDEKSYCMAIAAGFPDRIFQAVGNGWYENTETAERALLGRESSVQGAEKIIANELIHIQTKRGRMLPLITVATAAV